MNAVPRYATARRPELANRIDELELVADAIGFPLLPWARDALEMATELYDDGRPAHRRVLLTVPRQSGKSILVGCVVLERLLREKVYGIYIAQSRVAATSRLRSLGSALLESGLDREARLTLGTGNERLRFSNGSVLEVMSPTSSSVHGESIDVAVIDEAFAVPEFVMAAVSPAMAARPNAQMWIVSTAGTVADSHLLNALREEGRRDPDGGLAFVEYSKPDEIAPADLERFAEFHPGIAAGVIQLEHLRDEALHLPASDFLRAYGNITTATSSEWITAERWAESAALPGELPESIVLGVDAGKSGAAISAAYPTEDGYHVDLIEYREGSSADWITERLEGLRAHSPAALAWDRGGPITAIESELEAFALSINSPEFARSRSDRARGDMLVHELLTEGRLTRNVIDALDAAVGGAATVPAGDLWLFSRAKSAVDPSPLIASSLAVFAAHELHVLRPAPLVAWG